MPHCPICNRPLYCHDHGAVQLKAGGFFDVMTEMFSPEQAVVQPCPQKGAIWVHVTDDSGADVNKVATTVEGKGTKNTERAGTSIFDQLDPGPYKAKLGALSTDLAKRYDPPIRKEDPATVSGNDVVYVNFQLKRKKWTLKIDVTSATANAWPENEVRLILPSPLSNSSGMCNNAPWTSTLEGIAEVDGDATASSDGWDLVEQPAKVKLAPGDNQTIAFSLKRKPWIKFLIRKKLASGVKNFSRLTVKAKLPGWTGPEFTTGQAETHIQRLGAGTGEVEAMSADEPWEFESIESV